MTNKLIKILLYHTLILLISIISISIVNYFLYGGWIAIIIMMSVLVPQVVFIVFVVFYKIFSKKIKPNWILISLFVAEAMGIIFLGLESFGNLFPLIGYATLYVSLAFSWVMLTYYNGTWGKYNQKPKNKI